MLRFVDSWHNGAGTLIRASDGLDSHVFAEAAILLVAHSSQGATGVILGQPLHATESASEANAAGLVMRHFHGGPVGAESESGMQSPFLSIMYVQSSLIVSHE